MAKTLYSIGYEKARLADVVAALTAAGSVTMGSEAMSSARFSARKLKSVARAAMIDFIPSYR